MQKKLNYDENRGEWVMIEEKNLMLSNIFIFLKINRRKMLKNKMHIFFGGSPPKEWKGVVPTKNIDW